MLAQDVGLAYHSVRKIFDTINSCERFTYKVLVSFLQIYQDRIYDLLSLNPNNNRQNVALPLREHPREGFMLFLYIGVIILRLDFQKIQEYN